MSSNQALLIMAMVNYFFHIRRNILISAAITAVVIAISMISKFCKRLKYKRQIVLVTNGRGSMDADDVPEIASQLKAEEIELVIVYALVEDVCTTSNARLVESISMIQNTVSRKRTRTS